MRNLRLHLLLLRQFEKRIIRILINGQLLMSLFECEWIFPGNFSENFIKIGNTFKTTLKAGFGNVKILAQ